jgi:serine acetyltransferase
MDSRKAYRNLGPAVPEYLWALSRKLYRRRWRRAAQAVKVLNHALFKCLLPAEAEVGRNLVLMHYGLGVVMHPQVKIGDNCWIYHHVTLAAESVIGSPHFVIVGDGVTIGAHSIVVARPNTSLRIGSNAVVGAGSVVTKDVPANEVWAGNPARFLRSTTN